MFNLNRIKISLVLLTALLSQSCYLYKTTTIDEMKVGKHYRVHIEDGREITTKYLENSSDELVFKARNYKLNVSKKAIQSVERRRTSPLTYLMMIAAPAFILIDVLTNDKPSLQEELTDRVTG